MTTLDPRRRYPTRPVLDHHSAQALDDAIDTLIILRAPMHHGDAGAELHVLATIIAQAHARLGRTVADARDQHHTWAEIARQLHISRLHAIARYAGRTARRRTPLDPD